MTSASVIPLSLSIERVQLNAPSSVRHDGELSKAQDLQQLHGLIRRGVIIQQHTPVACQKIYNRATTIPHTYTHWLDGCLDSRLLTCNHLSRRRVANNLAPKLWFQDDCQGKRGRVKKVKRAGRRAHGSTTFGHVGWIYGVPVVVFVFLTENVTQREPECNAHNGGRNRTEINSLEMCFNILKK